MSVEFIWKIILSVKQLKMGKSSSKSVANTGDPQVVVLNQLEAHAEMHESHEVKVTIFAQPFNHYFVNRSDAYRAESYFRKTVEQ